MLPLPIKDDSIPSDPRLARRSKKINEAEKSRVAVVTWALDVDLRNLKPAVTVPEIMDVISDNSSSKDSSSIVDTIHNCFSSNSLFKILYSLTG